jgi:hypothetical protein
MKVISFFIGAGSSLLYALFGVMIFHTEIFWGINPTDWMFVMGIVGIGYTFLQMLQVVTMKAGGIGQGAWDIILSIIPAVVLVVGIITGHGDWKEFALYGGFIVIDGLLLVMTLRVFQLTSDVTITR